MNDISVMKSAIEKVEDGVELAIITITNSTGSTPRKKGTQMIVLKDGSTIGTIGGGTLEKRIIELGLIAIQLGESRNYSLPLNGEEIEMVCGGEVDIFIQVFKTRPKLLIVGGGHIAHALYNIASLLNFNIIIFEDRKEFISNERFPLAKELIFGPIDKSLKEYNINNSSYIVIVTRGHKYDEEALEAVLNSDAKYIGVMGSKNKITNMSNNLKEKGINYENLTNIYAPIGLNIATNSPEEIAVSILAEILLVKNNGKLEHMKNGI